MILVDIFRDIVKEASDDFGYTINYQFGDWQYMSKVLSAMGKSPVTANKKYPMIGLYSPFEEDRADPLYVGVNISMIIAVNTLKDYTNEDRLEKSFKDTLYPVYDILMKKISRCRYLNIGYKSIASHVKTDNFRYGRSGVYGEGKSEFDDRIDAIDIKDLRLKVNNNCRYGNKTI